MKKTPELIQKKWDNKLQILKTRAEISTKQNIQSMKKRLAEKTEQEIQKLQDRIIRRKESYLKKKEQEYKRKCQNEIRILEGKPERTYKKKKKTRNQKLQLALAIAQENAKLKDTNEYGECECITCKQHKTREEIAGGHMIGRQNQSVCLRPENINAQCHTCNYIMGPMGSPQRKHELEETYKKHATEKYGEDRITELLEHANKRYSDPKKYSPTEIFLDDYIPDLINENEQLRKTKKFQPKRNRRDYYNKHFIS